MNSSDEELIRRVHRELIDSYDEELESELEDRPLDSLPGDAEAPSRQASRFSEALGS